MLAVLIPCYDNQVGLDITLETLKEIEGVDRFKVVIVDDGSTVPLTVNSTALDLEIIRLPENKGVGYARSIGFEYILNGDFKYFACIDAGDRCLKTRFMKQIAFLEGSTDYAVVGSNIYFVNEEGVRFGCSQYFTGHKELKKALFYSSPLANPSVMMSVLAVSSVGGYCNTKEYAEDYDLFFRLSGSYKIANIEEPLTEYEISDNQITARNLNKQYLSALKVQLTHFSIFNIHSSLGLIKTILLILLPKRVINLIRRGKKEII